MAISTDEQEVLDKLLEVLEHGYGRVEVIIQNRRILNVIWEKSRLSNKPLSSYLTDVQEILEKIREVHEHGYGRVQVDVQDKQVWNLTWQKSQLIDKH